MKILFCTPAPLTKSLGAAKVVVELAEEMRELGWECDLVSIKDLAEASGQSMSESLRCYLLEHADKYDVVDYDHEYLPYNRSEFSCQTLFVARSVLLVHHLETIPIPTSHGVRSHLGLLLKGRIRMKEKQERVCRAQKTIEEADIVNVSNYEDKTELIRRGVDADKVLVIPYGISQTRRVLFDQIPCEPPKNPIVAFVGTFDYRKGAKEFPQIVQTILNQVPDARFHLLGVKGLFQTERQILSRFSKKSAQNIEVTLKYAPEELPSLLASCSVGIFPSYMEGMPFGALEMMAASLPVVAYNSPGLSMILPDEYLVTQGDSQAISAKVTELLKNNNHLAAARTWAKQQSQQFTWSKSAQTTTNLYKAYCHSIFNVL